MRKGLLLALVIIMSYYGCTKKIITEGAADITSQDETSVNAVSNADGKAGFLKLLTCSAFYAACSYSAFF
jgi:hypothetical protein